MHKYIAGLDPYKGSGTSSLGGVFKIISKKDSKTLVGEKIISIFVKK